MSSTPDELSQRREAKKPENRYCYQCPCGGQRFVLRPDAQLECCACHEIQRALIWGQFFQSATLQTEHPA